MWLGEVLEKDKLDSAESQRDEKFEQKSKASSVGFDKG